MRRDGVFIALAIDDQLVADPQLAARLAESCPVDIFTQADDGSVELAEGNLDECVLCRLCLEAALAWGQGAVRVIKLYDDGAVLA